MAQRKLLALLGVLAQSKAEFVVVGGLAGVLHGAPVQTYDVDIVYSRSPENINRLLEVLASLGAVFRVQPERRIQPNASHLLGTGHLNLLTTDGPLDLLATIGRNLGFEDLLRHSTMMEIGGGLRIRVLNLETLIEIKEQLAGEKDNAVLPVLRRTLMESKKRGPGG